MLAPGIQCGRIPENHFARNAFNLHPQVKLIFANINYDVSGIIGVSQSLGYKGLVYQIGIPVQDSFKLARNNYAEKLVGPDNPFEDRLINNFGGINPEFDNRWISQGFPATFIYLQGEKRPYYFSAQTTAEEIIAFVQTKKKSGPVSTLKQKK